MESLHCHLAQITPPYLSGGANMHTHTHPFNGPLSRTTQVSRYQKVKPISILLKQETVSGSGISWAICKSAPCSRQITTPAPHHSVFYRPDANPAARPTASKHWRHWGANMQPHLIPWICESSAEWHLNRFICFGNAHWCAQYTQTGNIDHVLCHDACSKCL